MRIKLDVDLKGYAMIFKGPLEMLTLAKELNQAAKRPLISEYAFKSESYIGRKCNGWNDIVAMYKGRWAEGLTRVEAMRTKLARVLPPPKSRKRKRVWSMDDGDVNVDRVFRGDPECFQQIKRRMTTAPMHVALLCNLDAVFGQTGPQIFWRGAAAIAATDLLEQAGYTVEVWMWCRGYNVFLHPNDAQFTCCMLKEAGQSVDVNKFINALSSWFLRTAVFGSFLVGPAKSIGGANFDLEEWRKYMDVTEGITEVHMPVAWSEDMAIGAAQAVLEEATQIRDKIEGEKPTEAFKRKNKISHW